MPIWLKIETAGGGRGGREGMSVYYVYIVISMSFVSGATLSKHPWGD